MKNIETNNTAALAAATAAASQAQAQVDNHLTLGAELATLKQRATDGDLDETGAAELMKKSELHRLGEITQPRRERTLADARAFEVLTALQVLRDLESQLDPIEKEAAEVADALTAALIHPQAASNDNEFSYYRDTGRTTVETFMHGTYPAKVLRERILTLSSTTWGSGHIPHEAAIVAEGFDAEIVAIKAGTAILRSALKAVQKISP